MKPAYVVSGLVLAVLGLAGLVVALRAGPGPTPAAPASPTPTSADVGVAPTPPPAASPAPAVTPTPPVTTPPVITAEPLPTPTLHPPPRPDLGATPPHDTPPLTGRAHLTDSPGDLVDTAGEPPSPPAPSADLVGVVLEGDGDVLTVTWEVAGELPDPGRALVWSFDVWVDDVLAHTVTVQQDGERLLAAVLDWETAEQRPLEDVTVEASTLRVEVPAEALPRVEGPFRWQALGQADGGFEDTVPDDRLAWFPLER